MGSIITRFISTVLIAGIALSLWQMSGGTQENFFATVWGAFYTVVSWVAQAFTALFNTIFHAV